LTVCIAAASIQDDVVVAASDRRLAFHYFSSDDGIRKATPIAKRWRAMFAGNDISSVPPIVASVRNRPQSDFATCEEVARWFADSYQSYRLRTALDRIVSLPGMDIEQFLRTGPELYGRDFPKLRKKIDQFDLEVEFLVYGFDLSPKPWMFIIKNPGTVEHYTDIGRWAIGTGAHTAYTSLGSIGSVDGLTGLRTADLIYRVCEAKFLAESASDVGRTTNISVLSRDGTERFVLNDTLSKIRNAWNETREIPMSIRELFDDPGAMQSLQEHLDTMMSKPRSG
jgi:hypothetical protein